MKEIKKVSLEEIDSVIDLIYETTILFNTSDVLKNDSNSKKIFSSIFKESFNDMEIFGYYKDDKIVGVIGIEDNNYIPILYVKKEYQNSHIGTLLLNYIIDYVKNKTDILEVCATKNALNFYLHNGFFRYNENDEDKIMMHYNYSKKKGDL